MILVILVFQVQCQVNFLKVNLSTFLQEHRLQFEIFWKKPLNLGFTRSSRILEEHKVTTEDGYILTIHRIPGGPNSIPVYLQHGLFESSKVWVITDETKSLGKIFLNLFKISSLEVSRSTESAKKIRFVF